MTDYQVFLSRLADVVDADELINILNLTPRQIAEAFPEELDEARKKGHFAEIEDAY